MCLCTHTGNNRCHCIVVLLYKFTQRLLMCYPVQVLRRENALEVMHWKQQQKAEQSKVKHMEAAQLHAVQEQFADDCLMKHHK